MPGRAPASEAIGATLYVVATPIGNLADVTLRALEVLQTVPLIAAEDTRITRRLLARHDIATPLRSYHAKSGAARLEVLLEHLRAGHDLALVTDAGTPGVSDPGDDLVIAWATEGGRVVPVPGPSAVLAAVAASGVAGPRWSFEGFLPRSGRERRDRLQRIARDGRGTVVFEAPSRLASTLRDLATACGAGRRAAVCRELTKVHEQVVRGTLGELVGGVTDGGIPARGEIVVVIAPADDDRVADAAAPEPGALTAARVAVDALVASGLGRREAARHVAERTGLPRRDLYRSDASG